MWRRAIHARNLLKEENPDAKFYMQSSAGDNAERRRDLRPEAGSELYGRRAAFSLDATG
jgi:hypothetical protein